MRIGLTARGSTVDEILEHAHWADGAGFACIWFGSAMLNDPLVAIAVAGRATTSIEFGTSVLQTFPCHPLLQANRAASVVAAMGRPGLNLGLGPSHAGRITGTYGLTCDRPAANTEEYVDIVVRLLRGEAVDATGEQWSVHTPSIPVAHPVPVLVSALQPRLLRLAGAVADGTILYLATARVIGSRIAAQIHAAAGDAGRPAPRIVAGLPVAVHDDLDEARATVQRNLGFIDAVPVYQRVLAEGGCSGVAEAAIVGDEASVTAQLQSLVDAGATEIWAGAFPVGDDPAASLRRTTGLLRGLLG